MKKLSLILALVMAISTITACGETNEAKTPAEKALDSYLKFVTTGDEKHLEGFLDSKTISALNELEEHDASDLFDSGYDSYEIIAMNVTEEYTDPNKIEEFVSSYTTMVNLPAKTFDIDAIEKIQVCSPDVKFDGELHEDLTWVIAETDSGAYELFVAGGVYCALLMETFTY